MLTVLSVTTSPCADFWSALSAAHAAADIAGMSITNAPVESANRTNVAVPSGKILKRAIEREPLLDAVVKSRAARAAAKH